MELIYILIGVFVGLLVGKIFSRRYDGIIIVDDSKEDKTNWILQYNGDPNDILKRKSIRFKVRIEK